MINRGRPAKSLDGIIIKKAYDLDLIIFSYNLQKHLSLTQKQLDFKEYQTNNENIYNLNKFINNNLFNGQRNFNSQLFKKVKRP